MIRVLVADDQSLVRAGFTALLDARDDIEVVGEASDGPAPWTWSSPAGPKNPTRRPNSMRSPSGNVK